MQPEQPQGRWPKVTVGVLRVVGVLLGLAIIILGIYSIVTGSVNPKSIVNAIYRVLFGILIVIAELRLERPLKFFSFLMSFAGLGLFYIFVGGLALGGAWYEIIVAVLLCAVGFFYLSLGCCQNQKMYEDKPAGTKSSTAGAEEMKVSKASSSKTSSPPQAAEVEMDLEDESAWPNDR